MTVARSLKWLLPGMVAAMLVIAAVPALFFLLIILEPRPDYDDDDPRYAGFVADFDRLDAEIRRAGALHTMDLASLNNGDWKTACLFGGYKNPLHEMRGLGGKVTPADEKRLEGLEDMGFRLDQVEESEVMIAFIDSGSNAHFG